MQILILEDDSSLRRSLQKLIGSKFEGADVTTAESVSEARIRLKENSPDAILTDLNLGDGSGIDLLKSAAELPAKPPVIILTGHATLETAVEALRLGAFDYLQKPFEEEHLLHTIRRALESSRLRQKVRDLASLTVEPVSSMPPPVQEDPRTKQLFYDAEKLAVGNAAILLTGESGTGKEVVARFIHAKSPRAADPFVALNCAAIPETLLESELFGYEKGAFTGAAGQRKGKFELADGGTLFLDEIGELPLALQPKLLRVLDGHGFLRLGGQSNVQADARIIAATNRKIDDEVRTGKFRDDLFFRLNVGRLDIPPLRERRADIAPLASRILENIKRKYRRPRAQLSESSLKKLAEYSWPGNVRELQNMIERAVLLASADQIDLPDALFSRTSSAPAETLDSGRPLAEILDGVERRLVEKAIAENSENKAAAARALGLSKQLLNYKLKKYGLD